MTLCQPEGTPICHKISHQLETACCRSFDAANLLEEDDDDDDEVDEDDEEDEEDKDFIDDKVDIRVEEESSDVDSSQGGSDDDDDDEPELDERQMRAGQQPGALRSASRKVF